MSNSIVQGLFDRAQAGKSEFYLLSFFGALGFYSVTRFVVSYFNLVRKFFLSPKTDVRTPPP